MNTLFEEKNIGKPFLKWAGGKGQLIEDIKDNLPYNFDKIKYFIEPFVGSGAVSFYILNNFPKIHIVINDINSDLINVYNVIKYNVNELINNLDKLEKKYKNLDNVEERSKLFYGIREQYNTRDTKYDTISVLNATQFIFLNKTCFNGLYRVNSKNLFNVPFGKYANPTICNKELLLLDNKLLQRVTILNTDYANTIEYANTDSFFYFDPPYKPISKTSSFNSYSFEQFDDKQQIRLKNFCDKITNLGAQIMLSNSDPKSIDDSNNFFDELYEKYYLKRVDAKRRINSKATKRGNIKELLIMNY